MPGFSPRVRSLALAAALGLAAAAALQARQNRIDIVAPPAPELAAHGPHPIGVRTMVVTDPDRPDVIGTRAGGPIVRADRSLTLEVWYPATATSGTAGGAYQVITRDPAIRVTLRGRAVRDAEPAAGRFPLVIISHGYPGNRFLMSHLGENLATKGYVAVSIDHTDSTYDNQRAFASTLYNRPYDQLFVLNEIARQAAPGSGSVLSGHVDAGRTGVVGYSMGGYGLVNVIGGGYAPGAAAFSGAPPNGLLAERSYTDPAYAASVDPRIRAAIAIGPWGMPAGYFDATGLAGIRTPVLLVAGSADQVSGYERGTRAIFEGAVNAPRHLLTFVNAGHNAAAPYPAPAEVLDAPAFAHYADPVWDTVRMNNILQHFATAYFDQHLRGDASKAAYLDVVPQGKDAVYAVDPEGRPQPTHTYWKGFKRGTAVGLVLEYRAPRQ